MKYRCAIILFVLCVSAFSVAQAQEPLELSLQVNKMYIEKQMDGKENDDLYQWFVIDVNLTSWYPERMVIADNIYAKLTYKEIYSFVSEPIFLYDYIDPLVQMDGQFVIHIPNLVADADIENLRLFIYNQNKEYELPIVLQFTASSVFLQNEEVSFTDNMIDPIILELLNTEAKKYHLNPAFLAAMIKQESDFDVYAESRKGARGLFQMMPDTFSWVAKNIGTDNKDMDLLFDPEINIRAGCYLINYIASTQVGDEMILVAASYHAGWGNIKTWIKTYSEDGSTLTVEQIPKDDTRRYVERILDNYTQYAENMMISNH